MTNRKARASTQLTKEQWLSRALEILSRRANSRLRVRDLAKDLGVTTGSFYWHFNGREDFVQSLLEYWERVYTDEARRITQAIERSPQYRLLFLMRMILEQKLSLYDSAFRAWATEDPHVSDYVAKVDAKRLGYVGSLFREMGFSGTELKMRLRLWLVYESNQFSLLDGMSQKQMAGLMRMRHALLTKKST